MHPVDTVRDRDWLLVLVSVAIPPSGRLCLSDRLRQRQRICNCCLNCDRTAANRTQIERLGYPLHKHLHRQLQLWEQPGLNAPIACKSLPLVDTIH